MSEEIKPGNLEEISLRGKTFNIKKVGKLFICNELTPLQKFEKEKITFPGDSKWGYFGAVSILITQIRKRTSLDHIRGYKPEDFYVVNKDNTITPLK
jgi:hypothetical protein